MKKPLFNRLTSLKSSYLIFAAVAAISLVAIVGLFYLTANAATPNVTVTRDTNNNVLDVAATLGSSSGYEYKFLTNSTNQKYWVYNTVSSASSCNSSGLGTGTSQGIRADSSTATSVTLNSITYDSTLTSDKYYCFQVLYGLANNNSSWLAHYVLFTLDNTAPQVTLTQAGGKLQVAVVDASNVATWALATSEYDADLTSCSSGSWSYSNKSNDDADFSINTNDAKKATFTPASNKNNYLHCFKVTDAQGNDGYSSPIRVDLLPPILVASQNNAILTITVNNTSRGHTTISQDTWQYKQTTSSTVCDKNLTNWRQLTGWTASTLTTSQATLPLTTSHNSKTYCFRLADSVGNYGYSQITISTINVPPVISSMRQSKQKVIARASDSSYLNSASWSYAITESSTCNSTVSATWQGDALTTSNNSNQASTATIDLSQLTIDESVNNQWLCLRVADNLAGNYGYRVLDIDVTAPTVTVVQNNTVLRASTKSGDRAQSSTWGYVSHNVVFTCDASAFTLYTPVARNNVASLRDSSIGRHYCFRVADNWGNYGYSTVHRVSSLDTTAPTVSAKQSNNVLILSARNVAQINSDTWGYVNTQQTANRVVCDNTYSYTNAPTNLRVKLQESDKGYWFCVRAADRNDNYGYFAIQIRALDATAPNISVIQKNDLLIASSTSTDVNNKSWQYAVIGLSDSLTCDAQNTQLNFNQASADNRRVRLTEAQNDLHYCFRVADSVGNRAYALSPRIANVNESPRIVVSQVSSQKRLEVSTAALDVDGLTWGWAVFAQDPGGCHDVAGYTNISYTGITQSTNRIVIRDIADTQDGSYYCFRVADTSDVTPRNYGYAKHRYDLVKPTIWFSFNDKTNILTVFSRSADIDQKTWYYATFNRRPADCSQETLSHALPHAKSNKLTLTSDFNNKYFCFKVADKAGNYVYALYAVKNIGVVRTPDITVQQTPTHATASSNDAGIVDNTWRWRATVSEPDCQSVDYTTGRRGSSTSVTLSSLNTDDAWLCFKVSNTAGHAGYAKWQIDRTPPVINITQNNVVLSVVSPDDDIDQSTWGYAKQKTDFTCNADVTFTALVVNNGQVSFDLLPADAGWYFCLRVADQVGHYTYRKVQIDTLDLKAPVIRLQQTNTVLRARATNVDVNSWQYMRSTADVNCSADNDDLSFNAAKPTNHQVRLTEADNGHWFCFKVVGQNGVDGYAKILVNNIDARRPVVEVKQKDNTLIATADETIKTWQYVVLTDGVLCNRAAFNDEDAVSSGNQVDLTADDHQATYCFRAVDRAGNAGYESLTVSLPTTDDTSQTPADESGDADMTDDDQPPIAPEDDDELPWVMIIGGAVIVLIILIIVVTLISTRRQKGDNDYGNGFGNDDYVQ